MKYTHPWVCLLFQGRNADCVAIPFFVEQAFKILDGLQVSQSLNELLVSNKITNTV